MNRKISLLLALLLLGCAEQEHIISKDIIVSTPGPVVEVPVNSKNITCSVYDITGMGVSVIPDFDTINNDAAGVIDVSTINNPTTNDTELFPMFVGTSVEALKVSFAIDCQARLIVPVDGAYQFNLTSDDGSILYVGGKKVIDNDGAHGNVTKTANVNLTKGTTRIRVTYYEGLGPKSLMLQWKVPGGLLTNMDDKDFAL